ncbi:MAG TPA: hypothetical protein VGR82_17605 [Methylomirabilota bacterium]|nr:hypothetical protein [Methylomirabilota bacterium]
MPANQYDALLQGLAGERTAAPTANPYDALLQQQARDREAQLRVSERTALDTTPDRAAAAQRLSQQTGLPDDVVLRNLDDVRKRATIDGRDYEAVIRDTPALATWLSQPTHAAIAQDDHEPLSMLERTLQFGGKLVGETKAGFYGASANFYGTLQGFLEVAQHEGGREAEQALIAGGMSRAEARAARAAAFTQPAPGADIVAGIRQHLQAVSQQQQRRTGAEGLIERGVLGGVQSLTQNALLLPLSLLTRSPAPMLTGMGALSFGGAYGTARNKGLSVETAVGYGSFQAAVEVATELTPANKLFGDLATNAGFRRLLTHQLKEEVLGEEIATVFQDLADWVVLPENTQKPFTEYLRERPSAAAETLVATIVATGLQTSAIHGLNRVAGGSPQQQVLEDLHAAAAASKTRERAPEAFHALVEQAAKDGLTHVYAPADTFTAYFQSKGENPAQVAFALTGDPDAYRLAMASPASSDLAIPTARYLTQMAGTGHEAFFAQELRLSPDHANARETQAQVEAQAAAVQQNAVREESAAPVQAAADRQAIVQDVTARLTATGRYTPQDAATQGALVASMFEALPAREGETALSRFRAWAARSGGAVTAAETIGAGSETIGASPETVVARNDAGEGATFLGWQETPDGPPMALYNVDGGALDRSTVTAGTLEARGIPVPETPAAPETFTPDYAQLPATLPTGEIISIRYPKPQLVEPSTTPQRAPTAGDVAALERQLQDTLANVPAARRPGEPRTEFFQAPPYTELEAEEQAVHDRFTDRLAQPDAEAAYAAIADTQGGKILNVDDVRELSEDYVTDRGAWGDATHDPASAFIDRLWEERLTAQPTGPVLLFAGGGGSGKSTIQKGVMRPEVDAADVVRDGVHGRYASTKQRIEDALGTGRDLQLVYVHLPFHEAVPRVADRAQKTGRTVPLERVAEDHVGAQETFLRISAEYADDSRVTVRMYDNTGSAPHEITREQLVALRYTRAGESLEATAARLQEELPDAERFRRLLDRAGRHGLRPDGRTGRGEARSDASADQRGEGQAGGGTDAARGTGPKPLTQGDDQPFGAFDPLTRLIKLLPRANRSTFLHELAHLFLELRSELALQPKATDQERADMATLLRRFGFDGDVAAWRALTDEQRRTHHEDFADAFEDYLAEGKAPTPELQPLFARFWSWLDAIYRQLRRSRVPLTDDVRAVMDRMVATEDAIAAAEADAQVRPLFLDAAAAGVPEAEFTGYRAKVAAASAQARGRLQAQIMRELAREQTEAWTQERQAVHAEVDAEIRQQPVYRALAAMRRGQQPDGTPLPDVQPRPTFNKDALVAQFGKGILATLPKGVPPLYSVLGGLPADVVAELFGFADGRALVDALSGAVPIDTVIEQETDRRMVERRGSLLTDPVQLAEQARDAVTAEHRDEVLRAEIRMLQRLRAAAAPSVRVARATTRAEGAAAVREAQAEGEAARTQAEAAAQESQRERDYERRWLEAEARLRIAIAEGRQQVEIDALTAEVQQLQAQARGGAARIRAALPDTATLTRGAHTQIASMRLKDIRPDRFFAAARRASRRATETAARQEFDDAIQAKQDELVNLALYREAVAARDAVDEARTRFDRMFGGDDAMAKRRNMDYVQVARAIAASYFWPERRLEDARDALELIRRHDPELFEMLSEHIAAARASGDSLGTLTFQGFQVMRDAVEALWEQSIRQQQMVIDGQRVERTAVIAALQARFDELGAPIRQAPITPTGKALLGGKAWLTRVEHWVDYMDGGEPNGVFRRYLFTPITEATARYRIHKGEYLQQYLDLVQSIEKTLTHQPIAAPELPGPEGEAHFTFANRGALLHALLHTGNESNFQKLLRGYGWAQLQEDGSIDPTRWRRFLDRMHREGVITKADWHFVQAVWDLNEALKPQSQQAHREMYGHYFSEITEWPVETPFGSYRGGYVPAWTDPLQVEAAAVRGEQDLREGDNSYMFPTTGRGFTQQRLESYAKPLALDLRLLPQHLDKVLRFIHLEPTVKDVGRLVFSHAFRDRLAAYDPTLTKEMLIPWLQRAASQRVARAGAWQPADNFWRMVRMRTGLNMMAGHVVNTLQQFTGGFVAATEVKPRHLRNALWRYVRHHTETVEAVLNASEFMRTFVTAQAIEVQQHIDDLLLNPSKYDQLRAYGQKHGYVLQATTQNIINIVSWVGAYEQAMEEIPDEREAVRRADAAVRMTQGSFAPEDIARIEAQTPFVRLFTMFSGYFNMLANQNVSKLATLLRDVGLRKGAGRAVYLYTMGFMLPAVVSEAILQALQGRLLDDEDDDGYLDELLALFFGSQVRTVAAMLPGGVLTSAYNFYATATSYDDRMSSSPVISAAEATVRAPFEVYDAIVGDGSKRRAVRDALDTIGLLTGLPTGAAKRPLSYLAGLADDDEAPDNALELAQGLVTGRAPER